MVPVGIFIRLEHFNLVIGIDLIPCHGREYVVKTSLVSSSMWRLSLIQVSMLGCYVAGFQVNRDSIFFGCCHILHRLSMLNTQRTMIQVNRKNSMGENTYNGRLGWSICDGMGHGCVVRSDMVGGWLAWSWHHLIVVWGFQVLPRLVTVGWDDVTVDLDFILGRLLALLGRLLAQWVISTLDLLASIRALILPLTLCEFIQTHHFLRTGPRDLCWSKLGAQR